jgi:hypothetical protein
MFTYYKYNCHLKCLHFFFFFRLSGQEGILIFSSFNEVRMLTLRSEHLTLVQKRQRRITGVMFNGHHVYWSTLDEGEERIMKSLDDGTEKEAVVSAGVGMPEDLTWDWVTKKVYFTDSLYKHVAACTEDGNSCTILVNTVTDKPRGIVVVPQDGLVLVRALFSNKISIKCAW